VADHLIKFRLPEIELNSRNLVFEVSLDAKKMGELHISEGGLDWWPRGARTRKCTKTWKQLRDFMEE
jgi:hypothetical protein